MAEGQRMTAADVVAKVMAGEHGDFVRDAVALIARELMEAEITAEIGAARGESSRSGWRKRVLPRRPSTVEAVALVAAAPGRRGRRGPIRRPR